MSRTNLGRVNSIRASLSLVFLLLFALIIVLGLESLSSLGDVNDASGQIRMHWLPSIRVVGELNNYTTDLPAAESALRRAVHPEEKARIAQQIVDLDYRIGAAAAAFQRIPRSVGEQTSFIDFMARWRAYRSAARNQAGDAELKATYDAASASLERLTHRIDAGASDAGARSNLAYSRAQQRIAWTIVLAGFLVAGAMVHVIRSISAPLVDLAMRMHRLAANETQVEIVGTQRRDEIGEMARAMVVFRNNAIDLAENRQALAQQTIILQEKLAEELHLARLQRNFLSMASHEFRTPLAVIDGHAQRMIAMRDRLSSVDLKARARKVRDAVQRMTRLIDNMIGSARIIDGRIDLNCHRTLVNLPAMVLETCQLQRELTPEAHIVEHLDEPTLMVEGDADLLRQAFSNLLSNAVKYSPLHGQIVVSTSSTGGFARIAVEDQGIGIPEAEFTQIFDRYFRGSNTVGVAGSGVGLYLVKTVVELHDGSVDLVSREGRGSLFTLNLPLRANSAAISRAAAAGLQFS